MRVHLGMTALTIHLVSIVGSQCRGTNKSSSDVDYHVLFTEDIALVPTVPNTFDRVHGGIWTSAKEQLSNLIGIELGEDVVFEKVDTYLLRLMKRHEANDLDVMYTEATYASQQWERVQAISPLMFNKDAAMVRLVSVSSSKKIDAKRLNTCLAQVQQLENCNAWSPHIMASDLRQLVTHPSAEKTADAIVKANSIKVDKTKSTIFVPLYNSVYSAFLGRIDTIRINTYSALTEVVDYDFRHNEVTLYLGDYVYTYLLAPVTFRLWLANDSFGSFYLANIKGKAPLLRKELSC